MNSVLVFIGGGFGAVSRYLIGNFFARYNFTLPIGTIFVNIVGSFLIGLILGFIGKNAESARLLLTVGFLGGFTTFSTFSMDTLKLIDAGNIFLAGVNIVGSVVIGLAAVYIGYKIGGGF